MANEVVDLARRFEPILHFHPQEKFFPSDAKRYLEHCALWKAESLFDEKGAWGGKGRPFPRNPLIAHNKIAASNDEIRPGDTFLGAQQGSAFPFLVDNQNEERFLELAGWKDAAGVTQTSQNRYANRQKVEQLYNTNVEPALRNSRFWYHAELFDTAHLRELIALQPSSDLPNLGNVLGKLAPLNPALLCYYFFFPAHEESLAPPCDTYATGPEFASFAGEWSCMALLLERPSGDEEYRPAWIGFTGRRNLEALQGLDPEGRLGMTVERWQVKTDVHQTILPETVDDHPKLFVSRGTHSLYLQPGTLTIKPYPPESYPQLCGYFDTPHALEQYDKSRPHQTQDKSAAVAKILGSLVFGGPLAGVLAATVEGNFPWGIEGAGERDDTRPEPDVTAMPGALGKVVHPAGLTLSPLDFPGAEFVKWAADENVEIAGRHYNFVVDRRAQVWWPSDDGKSGYRGRWGPRVANDPVDRRDGMRVPEFWKMFFVALAKAASK
ncbi:MAG TPA: hypothetical protein VF068_00285 [Rubrobacter sp.]